jgi:hypothetical protein
VIEALALVVAGVAVIAASEALARRLAPRYILGRTLAGARDMTIADAKALAVEGRTRYVRVHGRISSAEEFPDEQDRPLVYRRKRIEVQGPDGRWLAGATETEGVPFGVESRDSFVSVDSASLEAGLVVVPRHAEGVAADLPPELSAGAKPRAPARLVIEQVSAVEHAYVAGIPTLAGGGEVVMTAGRNRPLIVTTLDIDDAMRLLGAGGQRRRALALTAVLIAGLFVVVAGTVLAVLALI